MFLGAQSLRGKCKIGKTKKQTQENGSKAICYGYEIENMVIFIVLIEVAT